MRYEKKKKKKQWQNVKVKRKKKERNYEWMESLKDRKETIGVKARQRW